MAKEKTIKAIKVFNLNEHTREQWLESRKKGIGGSDLPIILGISNWGCKADLYREKTGLVKNQREPSNWYTLEYGNALESLIREAFSKTLGYPMYKSPWQYRHPEYYFMIGDADMFFYDAEGNLCGGEIKTSNSENRFAWHNGVLGQDGRLPESYEWQCRHYMALFDLNAWYCLCSFGNTLDDLVYVRIDRDMDKERFLIEKEKDFWYNHVLIGRPPVEERVSETAVKKFTQNLTVADRVVVDDEKPESVKVDLSGETIMTTAKRYLELYEEQKSAEAKVKRIKEQLNGLSLPLRERLGDNDIGNIAVDDNSFIEVNFRRRYTRSVNYDMLKERFPQAYETAVSYSESRPFSVKLKKVKVAKQASKKAKAAAF